MTLLEPFGLVARFVPDLASPGAWCVLGVSVILTALVLSGICLHFVERLFALMAMQSMTPAGTPARGFAPHAARSPSR